MKESYIFSKGKIFDSVCVKGGLWQKLPKLNITDTFNQIMWHAWQPLLTTGGHSCYSGKYLCQCCDLDYGVKHA